VVAILTGLLAAAKREICGSVPTIVVDSAPAINHWHCHKRPLRERYRVARGRQRGGTAMITNKAIGELADWAGSALRGDAASADAHRRRFYHIGASLVALREFQLRWQQNHHTRLETTARIEAEQIKRHAAPPLASAA
jgi:hypothetical protein